MSEQLLRKRLGYMADAMVSAVVGPKARFFSRERVDEIILLLREAEKALMDREAEARPGVAVAPSPSVIDALKMARRELAASGLWFDHPTLKEIDAALRAVAPPQEPT